MTHLSRAAGVCGLLVVLTLVGCSDRLQTERDNLWGQNEELQAEVERLRALLDRKDAQIAASQARLDELLAQQSMAPAPAPTDDPFGGLGDGITSTVTDSRVTIQIPGDVLFASGKVVLQTGVQSSLNEIARIINAEYPTEAIRVEGYTDTDPIKKSGWDDNLELSLQRAAAVVRYLDKQGVDAERMYAAGFGEHQPRSTKEQSRRVEIVVVLK